MERSRGDELVFMFLSLTMLEKHKISPGLLCNMTADNVFLAVPVNIENSVTMEAKPRLEEHKKLIVTHEEVLI